MTKQHIQPPLPRHLIDWIMISCPTCAHMSETKRSECQLARCPILADVALSITACTSMRPETLDLIDPPWRGNVGKNFYKLPEHCAAFVPIC